ncbi:MAG TPA: ABC transporter permease, partial [Vicinamibacterales bacterium]|nr:ABC transporter permease [Vicinamibacterales bacterium]
AILALTLGIGGNTAIFSVVDATRAQAIPYEDPERLVNLIGNVDRGAIERRGASYPDFLDWRAQMTQTFEDLAAVDSQLLTLSGADEPERIETEFVSAPYFSLLRATPALGRTFRSDEDQVAKPERVVVLSDGLWRRRFAADSGVIGRAVTLNGQPYTVVGVMPAGFFGVENDAQLWVPFAQWAPPETMARRGNRGFFVLGRLRPGITLAAAQSEANNVASRLAREYPTTNEARGIEVSPLVAEYFGRLRLAVRLLMVAIAFVLIIVCVNVANLLIARSEVRRREIALRVAIGASRARLLQQLVTESCVLTALGAIGGLFLAQLTVRLLVTQSPVPLPISFLPGLDARAAVFTIAVSLACGLAVGLAPWFQIRIADLSARLKESSRGSDGPRSQRLRNSLVVAEVALAILLVVGASLMIQSVRKLAAVAPGFEPQSLLTMHISVPSATTPRAPGTPARPVVTGRELLDRIGALPGVAAVALGNDVPLDGNSSASAYAAEGQGTFTAQNRPRTYVHRVSPGFFATMRIPFVRGRTFLEAEISPEPSSVVVSERLASRFWPGQDPIGKRIKFGEIESENPWMSIVGVVREVRYRRLASERDRDPDIYLPFADRNAQIAFAIRTTVPPASMVAPVREAIRDLNASIPLYGIAPMDERVHQQSSLSRFITWVMGVFAGMALWLCAVGIYGVMSYVVTQRTREIGIRLALGAHPREVLARIVSGGARLIAAGVVIGSFAAFGLRRVVSAQFVDVPLTDPAAGIALALFALVGLAACVVPGLRATRLDPMVALHHE